MYTNSVFIYQKTSLMIGLLVILFTSCKKDVDSFDVEDLKYSFLKPDHFPNATYTFDNNPITKDGFLLGRKLFYDPALSLDNSVSCNNCHIQGVAFADSQQHPFSVGVDDEVGIRNAPPLMNLAFYKEFFWDGGVTHLDFVPVNAIESEVEMKESFSNVVDKLNSTEEYRDLFNKAFDSDSVTGPFLLHALSQFMNRMVSASSKYDDFKTGDDCSFTVEEKEGLLLFEEKCATCHSGELFTNQGYANNGISSSFQDAGRATITELDSDIGKFRVPTLRNIEKTAPYMHNASFNSLEEVLEHYSDGVIQSETLDPRLIKADGSLGIDLTPNEKEKIITFLKTLTDYEFLQNQMFVEYN